MEEFTASNGILIRVPERGGTYDFMPKDGSRFYEIKAFSPGSGLDVALAEYYRAQEDKRLGRWRSKENPGWLVSIKPDDDGDHLVWPEYDPSQIEYSGGTLTDGSAKDVYEEFKRAHTPPIWRDASEGEVWELEFKSGKHAWFVNGAYFQSTKTFTNIHKNDPGIISARKIYPTE